MTECRHGSKKRLPCPWLKCPRGSDKHVITDKCINYVRVRDKTERGPIYSWKKIKP